MTSDLVLFAIRAGIRLGGQARQAYIEATKQREITLPLPDVNLDPTSDAAMDFFRLDAAEYLLEYPGLEALDKLVRAGNASPAQEDEYMERYEEIQIIESAKAGALPKTPDGLTGLDDEAIVAWLTVRQWQRDDEGNPKTLHKMVGTVIDVGVDYFASVPGTLRKDSRNGRIVGGFVDALDQIDFAEVEFNEAGFRDLTGRFFIAALETLSGQPELVTSDPNMRELVRVATAGLSKDVANKLAQVEDDHAKLDRIRNWSEMVFRSLLSTAGRKVVSEPGRFLGADGPADEALITKLGTSIIDLAVEDDELDLGRIFGRRGLETLLTSALEVVADYPEIVTSTNNEGIKTVISELARSLSADERLLTAGILPEVVRMVLDKTGKNMALIWPDLANDPKKHLLLTAASTSLEALSRPPKPGAKWKLRFGREDLLTVLEETLDDLAANPAWLVEAAGDSNANLGVVVDSVMKVLRKRGDQRLGADLAIEILTASVKAVALRQKFLSKTANTDVFVARAVDAVMAELFKDDQNQAAAWELLRQESVALMIEISLDRLADSTMDPAGLGGLRECVKKAVARVREDGEPLDLDEFNDCLEQTLAA